MKHLTIFINLFSFLLRFYPIQFRVEFEDEMQAVFTSRILAQANNRVDELIFICLKEYAALLFNVAQEYLSIFAKKFNLGNVQCIRTYNHLIGLGCLVFGIATGLKKIFFFTTGLDSIPYVEFTSATFITYAIIEIVFIGPAVWIFWQGIPNRKNKWGLLIPLLGVVFLDFLMDYFSKEVVYAMPLGNQLSWNAASIGWPFLRSILWGSVFSGLWSMVYHHPKDIFSFITMGVIAKGLGYITWQGTILWTYEVFHISAELPAYVHINF